MRLLNDHVGNALAEASDHAGKIVPQLVTQGLGLADIHVRVSENVDHNILEWPLHVGVAGGLLQSVWCAEAHGCKQILPMPLFGC